MSMVSGTTGRLRRGWDYYRRYTKRRTGVHAGATAALTIFGLLTYYERWFVVVAIVAYLVPPVYLYLTGDDLTDPDHPPERTDEHRTAPASEHTDPDRIGRDSNPVGGDSDADADSDSDSDDGDTDSDSDSDSDDGDSDSDSDG